jgi:3-dehydroquinate synthase
MNINYKINNKVHEIIFCPDREGLKITNKKKSYTTIARDLLKNYQNKKIVLIIDRNIDKKIINYLIHDLKVSFKNLKVMYISGSKKNKDTKLLFKIIDFLILNKFTKKSVIVSCGGGVIGDICGLASGLYLRGLIHYHIPTTMTAIVDSCVGGKTGINYKGIINSIGSYYHTDKVYISRNIINLIPDREYIAGIPEILKCGLISNKKIINMLLEKDKILKRDFKFITELITLSLKTKIKFFLNDVMELNKRLNLNFGHTFAHAIEMTLKTKYIEQIRHGEAVGIGLLCEIFYKEGKSKNFKLVKNILNMYGLPENIVKHTNQMNKSKIQKDIFKNIFLDKKRVGKYPRYIKLLKIGNSKISEMKNFKKINEIIKKVVIN